MTRVAWAGLGLCALSIGFVGIVVPLLPTTPFVLLAAICFARGSRRLHAWLDGHPAFGPAIDQWQKHGAISRPAKRVADLGVLVGQHDARRPS